MTTTPVAPGSRRTPKPTVTLDPIAEKLATVGLDYPASCVPELVEEATREQLTPLAFLDALLTRQLDHAQALGTPTREDAGGFRLDVSAAGRSPADRRARDVQLPPGEDQRPVPGPARRGQEPPRDRVRGQGDQETASPSATSSWTT
jgi:hypothetical protein